MIWIWLFLGLLVTGKVLLLREIFLWYQREFFVDEDDLMLAELEKPFKNRPELRDPWWRDCVYFCGDERLHCAVRPAGPCATCGDYEKKGKIYEN